MDIPLLIFLATALVGAVCADKVIDFETIIHCPYDRWCASIYFWEMDSSSDDDPVMYIRFCTSEHTRSFIRRVEAMGGDGSWWVIPRDFQTHYEITYKIFHTCHPLGRKSCEVDGPVKVIDYSMPIKTFPYREEYIGVHQERTEISLGKPVFKQNDLDGCVVPEAFYGVHHHNRYGSDPFGYHESDIGRLNYWINDQRYNVSLYD